MGSVHKSGALLNVMARTRNMTYIWQAWSGGGCWNIAVTSTVPHHRHGASESQASKFCFDVDWFSGSAKHHDQRELSLDCEEAIDYRVPTYIMSTSRGDEAISRSVLLGIAASWATMGSCEEAMGKLHSPFWAWCATPPGAASSEIKLPVYQETLVSDVVDAYRKIVTCGMVWCDEYVVFQCC